MASGNSSNANRYKGEDIDTDGDGSVNDAQKLQGNQPSDLGNTIDNYSIKENSSGDIFSVPENPIIGNFESGKDGWNFSGASRVTSPNKVGSYSVELGSITKDFDLSVVNQLKLWAIGGDTFQVFINGTELNTYSTDSSWKEFIIDLSDYNSSNSTLKIEKFSGGNGGCRVDFIRFSRPLKGENID